MTADLSAPILDSGEIRLRFMNVHFDHGIYKVIYMTMSRVASFPNIYTFLVLMILGN